MATDIVLASELSDQFDVGVLEANKIRLKFDAITTALTPKTWAGATINDAVASAEATTCNAMELSDGTYMATGRVSWAAHGLTVGSYYYLDQATAGAVTALQPTTGLVQRLFFVPDTDSVLVNVQEAYTI